MAKPRSLNERKADLLARFGRLNTWSRRGVRAPHKPLLALLALSRLENFGRKRLPFESIEGDLTGLLRDFGPVRQSHHPEYPFWRLQKDSLWQVTSDSPMESRASNTDAKVSELRRCHAKGGFLPDDIDLMASDSHLRDQIVAELLNSHFPQSTHEDLCAAIGLNREALNTAQPRDSRFRERVLRAYEYKCAICGMSIRMDQIVIGLEAAHIKWHMAGGPDTENNGLALCVLHHKLLDRGAIGLDSGVVVVSEASQTISGSIDWLLPFHGNPLSKPIRSNYIPAPEFQNWHWKEVFHRPARSRGSE